ncbi:WXG100 family type VII secretion target [Actinoplanes solisilvae]|uniref:WXG100 family type VII secretion target n=1 Tax=Actinoplanes solisilvae TaxID=2486853 RepID=UPI000FDB391C|nr:WXG100 family type VII secretion target [Actinoplanes solisilvae]
MPDIESSRIAVPSDLGDAPRFLMVAAEDLQEQLTSLARKLANLKADWIGQSGESYTDVQDMWDADAKALFDPEGGTLKQIAEAVRTVSQNYDLTEEFNVRTWRPLP